MRRSYYRPYEGRRQRLWLRVLCGLLAAGLLLFAVLEGIVLAGGHTRLREDQPPETMVILGCQVMERGPSELLQDRLDTALDYLETQPDLVRRMVEEGHTVGNHTYSHPDMSAIADEASFREELEQNEVLYRQVTGQEMAKLYRPPQGKFCESNLRMAQQLGYRTVFWSLAYVDWYEDDQPTREEAFDKLLPRVHPGAVVLLHSTSSTNAVILDELLTRWEEMGYTFGRLEEISL